MAGNDLRSEADVEAILHLAVRRSGRSTRDLRERLHMAANELGLSEEDLAEAEAEYWESLNDPDADLQGPPPFPAPALQNLPDTLALEFEDDYMLMARRRANGVWIHLLSSGFVCLIATIALTMARAPAAIIVMVASPFLLAFLIHLGVVFSATAHPETDRRVFRRRWTERRARRAQLEERIYGRKSTH
jgi:hypothetical protein